MPKSSAQTRAEMETRLMRARYSNCAAAYPPLAGAASMRG